MTDGSFAQGLLGVTLDGRYRLDAVLGEGGMGSVFRATQLAMDRRVAVKLLKPHLTSDDAALQRFAREARATQKVESPHAVKILDFGVTPHNDYYMVLEYLDGRTVQRELEIDGPFAPARVAHIARQALRALGVAHDLGLIHRDVKPDNLLLMRAGGDPDYTKVLDFGVAKLMQGAAAEQLALTAAGMVFGTPEFMSPEQACGQPLDGRSDLYSLAATMFVMLTGQGLFEGKSAIEWLTHHARTPPPRLAIVRPELAAYPELDDVLQRCLAKHREHRPATAGAMAAMLADLTPTLSRPPGPTAASNPPELVLAPTPLGRPQAAGPPGPAPTTGTPSSSAVRAFHASSYFRALGEAELALINTAGTTAVDTLTAAASSAQLPPSAPRSRRGWILGLGALALVAAGVAFGVVIHRGSRTTSISAADVPPARGPADAAASHDAPAGIAEALPADAATPDATSQSALDPRPPKPPPPTGIRPAPVRSAAAEAAEDHVRNAEAARAAGNNIKQLAEAQLALTADPRHARARFLLGDCLVKSGDLDRGCAYLHAVKRLPEARASAHAAGCPGD